MVKTSRCLSDILPRLKPLETTNKCTCFQNSMSWITHQFSKHLPTASQEWGSMLVRWLVSYHPEFIEQDLIQSSPRGQAGLALASSIFQRRNWGLGRWSDLPWVTLLVNFWAEAWIQVFCLQINSINLHQGLLCATLLRYQPYTSGIKKSSRTVDSWLSFSSFSLNCLPFPTTLCFSFTKTVTEPPTKCFLYNR